MSDIRLEKLEKELAQVKEELALLAKVKKELALLKETEALRREVYNSLWSCGFYKLGSVSNQLINEMMINLPWVSHSSLSQFHLEIFKVNQSDKLTWLSRWSIQFRKEALVESK